MSELVKHFRGKLGGDGTTKNPWWHPMIWHTGGLKIFCDVPLPGALVTGNPISGEHALGIVIAADDADMLVLWSPGKRPKSRNA